MAESQPQHPAGQSQGARRLKYGLNVLVAAILALALAVLINWVCYRHFYRHDFTAAGMYSLSPQTHSVIGDLKDNYRFVTLFRTGSPETARANDLVDEYARGSTKITVDHLDPTVDIDRLEKLYASLRDRYADKIKPMQAAVEDGQKALVKLEEQTHAQVDELQKLNKDPGLGEGDLPNFVGLVARSVTQLNSQLKSTGAELKRIIGEDTGLPNYTAARDKLKEWLTASDSRLYTKAITGFDKAAETPGLADSIKSSLLTLSDLFKASHKLISDANGALDAAPSVEDYDQLTSQLGAATDALVVISPNQVRVVPLEEMFRHLTPEQQAAMQEGRPVDRDFLGEERITGTLISLGLKTPPLIVFVSSGRQPALGPQGQYEQVASRLQKLNFKVEEWNPMGRPGPMGQPMPGGPPPTPAPGQNAVWIVLPIEPANPMMGMPGADQQIIPLLTARIGAGDSALITLGPSPTARFSDADPLGQMLQTWGIVAKADRVVMEEIPLPDRHKAANSYLAVDQWPSGLPITKALQSMAGLFVFAVPLDLSGAKAKSIETWPLVEIRRPGLWAETNLDQNAMRSAKLNPATAADSFVIGAAAESKTGRLVVVGSPAWAIDEITTNADARLQAPGLAELFGAAYPANAELFVNSVLWLTHMDQLIAASARTQDVRRVKPMTETAYHSLQWVLLIGMPLLTFASGVSVWLVRRRG